MPRGRKKKEIKEEVKVYNAPEVHVLTEKDNLTERHKELSGVHNFLLTNKLNDIGQVEVALAAVNHRLTEL